MFQNAGVCFPCDLPQQQVTKKGYNYSANQVKYKTLMGHPFNGNLTCAKNHRIGHACHRQHKGTAGADRRGKTTKSL